MSFHMMEGFVSRLNETGCARLWWDESHRMEIVVIPNAMATIWTKDSDSLEIWVVRVLFMMKLETMYPLWSASWTSQQEGRWVI